MTIYSSKGGGEFGGHLGNGLTLKEVGTMRLPFM